MGFLTHIQERLEWAPWRSWQLADVVESADQVPEYIPGKRAILIGTFARPKWLAFDCPCRSGHRVLLNLDRNRNPFWTLLDTGRLTIKPSVDFHGNHRRCHYFVSNGRIRWVDGR